MSDVRFLGPQRDLGSVEDAWGGPMPIQDYLRQIITRVAEYAASPEDMRILALAQARTAVACLEGEDLDAARAFLVDALDYIERAKGEVG